MDEQLDRITPTQRPRAFAVNRQKWRNLLFLHWAVPVSQLRPLIPDTLEIDTFEGNAYLGLIPFTVVGARAPWTPPLPFVSTFDEVNVRTYVHHRGKNPGVFFFTLDASSRLAVTLGRSWFRLPYRRSTIRVVPLYPFGSGFDYTARRPDDSAAMHVVFETEGELTVAQPGTLDHFLIERYVLYTAARQKLYSAKVHHDPYNIRDATIRMFDETMLRSCGVLRPHAAPIVHYSPGVDTEIFALKRVT